MFGAFNVMFSLIFIMVLGVFAFVIIRGISQWNKNNNSPRLTVEALVVTKRTSVHHHNSGVNNDMMSSSTSYYITFEFESTDRMELCVNGREYGMIAEGDKGQLTFQGTRFISFERK